MENQATTEQERNRQWKAESAYLTHDDPLLACLTVLTKLLRKPHSPDSMVAGLPLVDNRLSPELFSRAAERAGLSSKVIKKQGCYENSKDFFRFVFHFFYFFLIILILCLVQ